MDDTPDFHALVSTQHHELLAASAAESDLDFAYRLQLQEALAASLSDQPSSSSLLPPPTEDTSMPSAFDLHGLELHRFLQEHSDAQLSRTQMALVRRDLHLRSHDARFAREILAVPDDVWERDGDNIENPIAAGDAGTSGGEEEAFKLYFKGLASEEAPGVAAVGVSLCDPSGIVVLKIQKPVPPAGKKILDATAFVEGLHAALSLGITCLDVFIDAVPLYNHVTGRWPIKQRGLETIITQAELLQNNFEVCNIHLLPRSQIQHAIRLAKDAIDSYIKKDNGKAKNQQSKETCIICLEECDSSNFFTVDNCNHRFCFSCMRQHVEVQLLHGALPGCPHEGCKTKLDVESSKKFLPPKLSQTMADRLMEASIPEVERVYCPYPRCSALMSRRKTILVDLGSSSSRISLNSSGVGKCAKCAKCNNLFCIDCKVPWHVGMSCIDYQRFVPITCPDDAKLKALARSRLWRQCIKCHQMIELAEGCYHMTCRCGAEFCYTCGSPWTNKKATCSCPFWDERFILRNQNNVHAREPNIFHMDDVDDYSSDDDYFL